MTDKLAPTPAVPNEPSPLFSEDVLESLREAIWLCRTSRKASIGAFEDTYTPQISVAQVERWDAAYQAIASKMRGQTAATPQASNTTEKK